MKDDFKTLIIIPAYNEEQSIASVIDDVRSAQFHDILVIDDCSTDDTLKVVQERGASVISLSERLGAWGATQTGLRYAIRKGFDLAVTLDADGQHYPSALVDLIAPVTAGAANVSIGSCTQRGSRLRKFAWNLIRTASGITVRDLTSGFRVYDRLAIRRAASWRGTLLEYQDVGVLMLLQRHGLAVAGVEVQMTQRMDGKSRIFHNWGVVAYYMAHTLILGACKRISLKKYAGPSKVPKVFL